jgi:hypothetical protein
LYTFLSEEEGQNSRDQVAQIDVAGVGGGFSEANSIKVDASGQSEHRGDCAMDVLVALILHAKTV